MTGGRPQQARPLDQGRYVGNPNHMAQKGAVLPNMNVGIQDMAMRNPDGSISGGGSFSQNINDNSNSPVKIAPATQPIGLKDANGNLVTNNVGYGDGSANNQSFMQVPNRTPINGAIVGGTIATTPPPSNINTMAAEGIKAAGLGTAQGMGFQPLSVNANQLSNTSLTPYMNPYDDAVVKANEADILRGAQIGMNNLQGQAQAAKAFGGSRHGVAMGEIGRDTVSQLAQASAGLRQAGFQNAQNAALADIQNNMQGQLANQQADLSGAGQRLSAANQLGQIANLGFGMGQTVNNNLMAQGAMQQALQQSVLDAAANKYQGYVQHPAQGLAYLNAALGVTPTTPQTTTTTKQPGLFDYLTLGASGYTGGA